MATNNPYLSLVDFRIGSLNDMGLNDKVAYLEAQIGTGATSVYDVMNYGAVGNGVADDTLAIQAALDACFNAGGGTVYFPNGTYMVRNNTAVVGWAGCVGLKSNTKMLGESRRGAVIKLMANQVPFTRAVVSNGATHSFMESLTIDGNKANQATPEEHMSGLFIGSTIRLTIRDCTFINCVGDGISIWSSNEDTLVENCHVTACNRSGISMTGGFQKRVTMRKCQLETNLVQQIDMEAPDGPFEDVTVDDCYLQSTEGAAEAVALSGQEENVQVRGISFVNNVVVGTTLVRWVRDLRFANNKCATRTGDTGSVLAIDGVCERVEVVGNSFTALHTSDAINVAITGRGLGDTPKHVVFAHNNVNCPIGHYGVIVSSADSAVVVGNQINSGTRTLGDNHGVSIRSSFTTEVMTRVEVRDNFINNFTKGLTAWGRTDIPTGFINELIVTGNYVVGDASCWAFNFNFDATNAVQRAVIFGNDTKGNYGSVEAWPNCPVLIGGTREAGGVYSVTGTPEGVVADAVGSMAVRRDGGAGTTLYIKESGTGNTGWVAK